MDKSVFIHILSTRLFKNVDKVDLSTYPRSIGNNRFLFKKRFNIINKKKECKELSKRRIYYLQNMKKTFFLTLTYLWGCLYLCMAQPVSLTQEMQLAEEYTRQNELDKARDIYRKLIKDERAIALVQKKYVQLLQTLQAWEEAEKFLKKQIRTFSDEPIYKAEYVVILDQANRKSESEKIRSRLSEDVKGDPQWVHAVAQYFVEAHHLEWSIQLYQNARNAASNKSDYAFQLAQLYKITGEVERMLDEYVSVAVENKDNLPLIQNLMQDDLEKPEDFDKLEKVLLTKLQKEPNQLIYNDLLVWFYMQQKDFHRAFVQARAIDRRLKQEGTKIMEIGQVSLQNKDYKAAMEIFEYFIKEYPQSQNYMLARRYLINAKEEVVKNTFPMQKSSIRSLVGDYQALLQEVGKTPRTVEAMRSVARLYGFYLNEKDSAIVILKEAIQLGRADHRFVNQSKLDLGDIYLLKNEPWEATLIYSQVEKDEQDSPLGYEAKLRNAKLAYYKNDFQLAQEHLDILKLATSREIANDAMDLSILIQDNTAMDSTGAAMRDYAKVELLLFQNRDEEAVTLLDSMLVRYPAHSLSDEVLWQQAQLFIKQGRNEEAAKKLQTIEQNYGYDILSDDAAFTLALLKEEKLGKKEEALELYKNFLVKYPGSIFVVEARKRYRILRGDTTQ